MAEITVEQAWDAIDYEWNEQDIDNSTATIYYLVSGTDQDAAALAAVSDFAPVSFQGIPRQSLAVNERLTETHWKIEARYAGDNENSEEQTEEEEEEPQFNFDVSGGSRRIITGLKQKAKYPANAPDSQGINDGEGVDIVIPVCSISETHYFRPSKITTAWKRKVASMVGCINGKSFWGFEAGELLFTGCSGTRTGDKSSDKWQVTFRFSVQMNQSNIPVGTLCNATKRGWDLLWVRYKEQEVDVGNGKKAVLNVPVAAYIEQIYPEANFSSLGI